MDLFPEWVAGFIDKLKVPVLVSAAPTAISKEQISDALRHPAAALPDCSKSTRDLNVRVMLKLLALEPPIPDKVSAFQKVEVLGQARSPDRHSIGKR